MLKNIRALFFVAVLVALLTFLVGFRYGRFVERSDKVYLSTITPTALPTYTPAPTIKTTGYKTYKLAPCRLSFLYPDSLNIDTSSSQEARLNDKNNHIYVSCDREMVFAKREALIELESTTTATVSGQKIPLYDKNNDTTIFILPNPRLGRSVFIEVTANMRDLLLQTLKFEN